MHCRGFAYQSIPKQPQCTICPGLFRGYSRKKGHVCGLTQKRAKKSIKMAQL